MIKRLEDTPQKPNSSGGYFRVFGDEAIASIFSRVQSFVISEGTNLEKIIKSRCKVIDDIAFFDSVIKAQKIPDGIHIVPRTTLNKSIVKTESNPDFFVLKNVDGVQSAYIVELKDGHVFDTKKASAERLVCEKFIAENGGKLPFTIQWYLCSFNREDIDDIYTGLKTRIPKANILTGRKFCQLLEIDYDDIIDFRKSNRSGNIDFLVEMILSSVDLKNRIIKKLNLG